MMMDTSISPISFHYHLSTLLSPTRDVRSNYAYPTSSGFSLDVQNASILARTLASASKKQEAEQVQPYSGFGSDFLTEIQANFETFAQTANVENITEAFQSVSTTANRSSYYGTFTENALTLLASTSDNFSYYSGLSSDTDVQETGLEERAYSSDSFDAVMEAYRSIHIPLVLSICSFGVLANVLLLIVITRRNMLGATNALLTGLSFAQLCLLANFFCYSLYSFYDTPCNPYTKTYVALVYVLMNVNLNITFHTIALVHTTLLAVFRYISVAFPTRYKRFISMDGAKRAIVVTYIGVPLLCIPIFCATVVDGSDPDFGGNCSENHGWRLKLRSDAHGLLSFNFWFFATVCKLAPCASLAVLSGLLVAKMREAKDRRQKLLKSNPVDQSKRGQNHRRVTLMLLIVVLLFILVEMPQGILNLLSGALGDSFRREIYWQVADFFEMLTVLYSSVNFVLYCSMSSQFRTAFKQTIMRPLLAALHLQKLMLITNQNGNILRQNSLETSVAVGTSRVVDERLTLLQAQKRLSEAVANNNTLILDRSLNMTSSVHMPSTTSGEPISNFV